ncbi:MAG: nucleoside triphosphate pyrophosphatase [Anaerovoracaceae bacterium]|jgi:septum formation protein
MWKELELVLASGSPRRIEIMHRHELYPRVCPSSAEEKYPDFLTPAETTMYLAMLKADDVRIEFGSDPTLIVGADTIVTIDGRILGKPANSEEAMEMLMRMSGRRHEVITGVALLSTDRPLTRCFYEVSGVWFRDLPRREMERYVRTDEPYDKAGGYAIQGTFSRYTEKIEGSRDNIIGFPWQRFVKELFCLL